MQGCHYLETWKNLEFDNLSKKYLEFEKFRKNPGVLNKNLKKTCNF